MFKHLLNTKQLSIYFIFASLVVSSAMMHPTFSTLMIALPVNAVILVGLRWVAHQEGKTMF
jgi:hypothetical protein